MPKRKPKISYGKLRPGQHYRPVALASLIGKTVEAIGRSQSDGPNGPEPVTELYFSDGTHHGFVHPQPEEPIIRGEQF